MLLAGIYAMIWWYAAQKAEEPLNNISERDPLATWQSTPSQRATLKYFWVVSALMLAQMLMGMVTAHYGVEGDGFYGFKIASWLPYSVARTWHVQLGIFWTRSSEFLGSPLMQKLRWMRIPGDAIFALGAIAVVAFVITHRTPRRKTLIRPGAVPVVSGD
jgi:nitric oxide reductase large subunit